MEAPSWATHVASGVMGGTLYKVWICQGMYQYFKGSFDTSVNKFGWGPKDWEEAIKRDWDSPHIEPVNICLENK